MAKIVLVKNPTSDQENVGDILEIHDEKTELGPSYENFQIVEIEGDVKEIRKAIRDAVPKIGTIFKSKASKNKWTFEHPQEKTVWENNGEWEELARPKNLSRIENAEGLTLENIKGRISHNLASKGKVTVS